MSLGEKLGYESDMDAYISIHERNIMSYIGLIDGYTYIEK